MSVLVLPPRLQFVIMCSRQEWREKGSSHAMSHLIVGLCWELGANKFGDDSIYPVKPMFWGQWNLESTRNEVSVLDL